MPDLHPKTFLEIFIFPSLLRYLNTSEFPALEKLKLLFLSRLHLLSYPIPVASPCHSYPRPHVPIPPRSKRATGLVGKAERQEGEDEESLLFRLLLLRDAVLCAFLLVRAALEPRLVGSSPPHPPFPQSTSPRHPAMTMTTPLNKAGSRPSKDLNNHSEYYLLVPCRLL